MAKTTSQKAIAMIGNKFDMVLIAAARARELKRGKKSTMAGADASSPIVTALTEIEVGLVGREYLRKLRPGKKART